ncbi:RNA-directed DNA polymerase [Chlorobium sp. BLA1]|uniref:retron St85 family RNA-directed DNA polymerase n=1 Tax=Candidatus Chlorobium masyuteum TaxID=2716876 RepID=UPI00142447B2|nr:retron St85 family RNA-directed DNA polymerase [Candidatus Chlorobium masyuteum]NHQ60841.1 RNA-directed DNA polymerase [Candidatus Chlorobium masyuteum]
MHIRDAIAIDLSVPVSIVDEALKESRIYVKKFTLPKKSGGSREIFHPSKKLKTVQYWLIFNILSKLPIHSSAVAYRDGISILNNAKKHCHNRFFLKLDLKEFFHSIVFSDLLPLIEDWYQNISVDWVFGPEEKDLIRKSCFYKEDRLAIGYPSSPVISNVVMYQFDLNVESLVSSGRFGDVCYTRYADDLIFSTDKKGGCKVLLREISDLIGRHKSPDITLNSAKTRLGSSTGGTASVTGLKVCNNGYITVHRKQKDHIRLLLSLYAKGELKPDEYRSLLGHLAYCHYVAPSFYSRLAQKYFKEIHELRASVF